MRRILIEVARRKLQDKGGGGRVRVALDADDAELTRTRKVRRTFIAERYGEIVQALQGGADEITVETEALMRNVREHAEKILTLRGEFSGDVGNILENIDDPGKLADLVNGLEQTHRMGVRYPIPTYMKFFSRYSIKAGWKTERVARSTSRTR